MMGRTKLKYILGLISVIVLLISYQYIYYNKYFPIQEGWFYVYAKNILNGQMIYKDFYAFLQPIYIYILTFIAYISDYSFIALRNYGLLEQTILITLLFTLYQRATNILNASIATILTFMVYNTNTNDVIYSYYQLALIFGLLSTLFLHNYFMKEKSLSLFLSGSFAGLSFLIKQSSGLIFIISFGILLLLVLFNKNKISFKTLGLYVIGVLSPIIILYSILYSNDILLLYFQQVFGGSSSKGSILGILFGFINRMYNLNDFLVVIGLFLIINTHPYINFFKYFFFGLDNRIEIYLADKKVILYILVTIITVLAVALPPFYLQEFNKLYTELNMFSNKLRLVHITFYSVIIVTLFYFWKTIKNKIVESDYIIMVLLTVGLSTMCSHGLSGVLEVHSVIPALGLLYILLINTKTPLRYMKNLVLFTLVIIVLASSSLQKTIWMYSWWGWNEGSYALSKYESNSKYLKGFLLSLESKNIIDGITEDIEKNSNKDEILYTFPHIPMFHVLADRSSETFSQIHYFDVCPDRIAQSDAKKLLAYPPKIFVEMIFPESAWKIHEDIFRQGKKSGQRDIEKALNGFKNSNKYKKINSYITPAYGYTIEVWKKND